MTKKILFLFAMLVLFMASCSDNNTPEPGDSPSYYIDYCTIEGDGTDGYTLHCDGGKPYLKFKMQSLPSLTQIVESGTRRLYAVFQLPQSFDTNRLSGNKVDTILVEGATIKHATALATYDVMSSTEAQENGITSPDHCIETSDILVHGAHGYITVVGQYGYLVSNEGELPVNVYAVVDPGHCSSDVLALRILYIRTEMDGYDVIRYKSETDCFSLAPLAEQYGKCDNVTVEIRVKGKVITTFTMPGRDFKAPGE